VKLAAAGLAAALLGCSAGGPTPPGGGAGSYYVRPCADRYEATYAEWVTRTDLEAHAGPLLVCGVEVHELSGAFTEQYGVGPMSHMLWTRPWSWQLRAALPPWRFSGGRYHPRF
jgi:hypothetical protein